MCWKKKVFFILIAFSIIGSDAGGEFTVIYASDSVKFSGHSTIYESYLHDLFSAILGMSVDESFMWNGLVINNPFDLPEAVVLIYIEGVSDLEMDARGKTFPLMESEYESVVFDVVTERIRIRNRQHGGGGNHFMNIKLSSYKLILKYFVELDVPRVPTTESLSHLRTYIAEDIYFLQEIANLNSIIDRVNAGFIRPDNRPDFYIFQVSTLHTLSDYHGPNSPATIEAKNLLNDAIARLSAAFVKTYSGRVVVTASCSKPSPGRYVRTVHELRDVKVSDFVVMEDNGGASEWLDPLKQSIPDKYKTEDGTSRDVFTKPMSGGTYKIARRSANKFYMRQAPGGAPGGRGGDGREGTSEGEEEEEPGAGGDVRPAMFQIFLWFSVVTSFALVGVIHKILSMDPGKDSINYRLTATITKKDN